MLYYSGIVNSIVIILLTIPSCMTFILYAVNRKNVIAIQYQRLFLLCVILHMRPLIILFNEKAKFVKLFL